MGGLGLGCRGCCKAVIEYIEWIELGSNIEIDDSSQFCIRPKNGLRQLEMHYSVSER